MPGAQPIGLHPYETAGALADDLERFLRHEPIHARPIGRIERGGRWARRNPTAVSLLVSLLVLCGVLIAQGMRELASAARRRAEKAHLTARWESGALLVKQGRFADARTILGRLADGGFEDLRRRIDRSLADLNLVEELDAVGLNRVSVSDGHYDMRSNKVGADEIYQKFLIVSEWGTLKTIQRLSRNRSVVRISKPRWSRRSTIGRCVRPT